ncbi:MAG: hypothetical protein RIC35_07790 [Marinoscillum sp.]
MYKQQSLITWLILIGILSAYVIFSHTTDHVATSLDEQKARQERWVNGESEFFNPWQYRVLSPLLIQGGIIAYESFSDGRNSEIPFIALHYIQVFVLFYCFLVLLRKIPIQNPFLLFVGITLICYHMANSTFKSGLSIDTYFDVVFYLLAGIFVIKRKYFWIIPLSFIACLNRETSAFIPLMIFTPYIGKETFKSKQRWIAFVCSGFAYALAFLIPRIYFGLEPAKGIHGMTDPFDYLTFNLTYLRLYPLLIGTLSIIPLVVLLNLKKLKHPHLKTWFWLIVPIWLVIHFVKSNAVETRLFLVPQILIFVPSFLYLIDNWRMQKPKPKERSQQSGKKFEYVLKQELTGPVE